jgi:hypothetical protein
LCVFRICVYEKSVCVKERERERDVCSESVCVSCFQNMCVCIRETSVCRCVRGMEKQMRVCEREREISVCVYSNTHPKC